MDEKRRMFAKSVIMKGLESEYSSYDSETEEDVQILSVNSRNTQIPRHPSIQFEDYTSEDDVQFVGIKSSQSPIHILLSNWDSLYPK